MEGVLGCAERDGDAGREIDRVGGHSTCFAVLAPSPYLLVL